MVMGSTVRARLLRLFVFNQGDSFTVAQIAKRSGISANLASKELQILLKAGIVKRGVFSIQVTGGRRKVEGSQKEQMWTLDPACPHLRALSSFVHEVSPIPEAAILAALKGIGKLSTVILSGVFMGDPSRPADLIIAADSVKEHKLEQAIKSLEPVLGREIRYAVFTTTELQYRVTIQDRVIRETIDYPHVLLLDKGLLFA